MSYDLVKCAYCGTVTIRRSPKQKYCNITCCNRAQYRKYKRRSAEQAAAAPPTVSITTTPDAQPVEQPISFSAQLEAEEAAARASEKAAADFSEALRDVYGYESRRATERVEDISQEEYDKRQQQQSQRPLHGGLGYLSKEQVAAYKQKMEEDRLIALDKATRAERRRQRAIARGTELDQKKPAEDNPWVEKMPKKLDDI